MTITITVNLDDQEYDLEYNVEVVQDAIDSAAEAHPSWTSMVVVFSNPKDIVEIRRHG